MANTIFCHMFSSYEDLSKVIQVRSERKASVWQFIMVSILHFCYRYLTVYETFPPPYTRNILFGMNTWWMNALFSFGKNKSGVQILSNLLESNSKMSSFPDVQVVKRASTQLKWSMMLTVKSCKEIQLGIIWSMNLGCMHIHVKKGNQEYWIRYV